MSIWSLVPASFSEKLLPKVDDRKLGSSGGSALLVSKTLPGILRPLSNLHCRKKKKSKCHYSSLAQLMVKGVEKKNTSSHMNVKLCPLTMYKAILFTPQTDACHHMSMHQAIIVVVSNDLSPPLQNSSKLLLSLPPYK